MSVDLFDSINIDDLNNIEDIEKYFTKFIEFLNKTNITTINEINTDIIDNYISKIFKKIMVEYNKSFVNKKHVETQNTWTSINFYNQPSLVSYLSDNKLIIEKIAIDGSIYKEIIPIYIIKDDYISLINKLIDKYKLKILMNFIIYHIIYVCKINTKNNKFKLITSVKNHYNINDFKIDLSMINVYLEYYASKMKLNVEINKNIMIAILSYIKDNKVNIHTCAINNLLVQSINNISLVLDDNLICDKNNELLNSIIKIFEKSKYKTHELLIFLSLFCYKLSNFNYAQIFLLTANVYYIINEMNWKVSRFINCVNMTRINIMSLSDLQHSMFDFYIYKQLNQNKVIEEDEDEKDKDKAIKKDKKDKDDKLINSEEILLESEDIFYYIVYKEITNKYNDDDLKCLKYILSYKNKDTQINSFNFNDYYEKILINNVDPKCRICSILINDNHINNAFLTKWYLNLIANEYSIDINFNFSETTISEYINNNIYDKNKVLILAFTTQPDVKNTINHYIGITLYVYYNENENEYNYIWTIVEDLAAPMIYTMKTNKFDINYNHMVISYQVVPIYSILFDKIKNTKNIHINEIRKFEETENPDYFLNDLYEYDSNNDEDKYQEINVIDRFIGGNYIIKNINKLCLIFLIILFIIVIIIKFIIKFKNSSFKLT